MAEFLELWKGVFNVFVFLGTYFIYWAPFVFGIALYNLWQVYVQRRYIANMQWVLLEVQLPREIKKTPLAMEVMLASLHQTAAGTWYSQMFEGKVKDWFSLEIVSLGGQIKFFVRTPDVYKNIIESQIYGQYPDAEVHEVPDYTRYVEYIDGKKGWDMFGSEYTLAGPDALPIKTYVDYGLDREGIKDEEKVDPMTALIEYLGTMTPGEQMWIQILVQATGKRFHAPGSKKKDDWRAEGQRIIDKIYASHRSDTGELIGQNLTEEEKSKVKAIERNISKLGFDCGVRVLYWTKDHFRVTNIKGLLGIMKPFNTNNLNSFKPSNVTGFDYPWEDYKNIRQMGRKKRIYNAYKRRGWFYRPYKRKPFVLNSEELATIFHFPGSVAETPTFGRIESRKAEPPINLPI